MSNYVIKGFLNNQIALQLDDGTIRNFPLPVQPDGTYLTGDALNSLLGTYANNAVLTTTTSDVVLGTNISEILGLIQVTDREIELAWKKIISTVKGTRNTLMKYTDKTQLGDFPGLTPELKDSWNVYRQQVLYI